MAEGREVGSLLILQDLLFFVTCGRRRYPKLLFGWA